MPPNHRRLVNNLFDRLKLSQVDDVRLPAPAVMEIKHLLKNSYFCAQVFVGEMQFGDAMTTAPFHIPQFIASQLDAQNSADMGRRFAQISAVLSIACEYLAPNPIEIPAYPVLFRWNGLDNQRTYCLFAFLTCSMESRSYSVGELLQLRGQQAPQLALERLKEDPEISDVVKGKGNAVPSTQQSQQSQQSQQLQRLKQAKEDVSSSTDSDEILFQGKKQAHQGAEDVQWKYRGRTGSEVTSSEPLPAPTGLVAQQSEGFQRFFKAVVSPTHVRVTAGGRIVPNTRGSASPTAKWDKDRPGQEGQGPVEITKEGQPEAVAGANDQAPPPPMMPPVFPGHPAHPAFFHHMGLPMPLYPMPAGLPWGYGIPPGHAPLPPYMPQPLLAPGQQGAMVASTQGKPEGGSAKKPKPAPVKISPPDQFDQSRPFIFNGHIYPSPMVGGPPHMAPLIPGPYLPPGMMGHPAFAHNRFQPMPHPFVFGPPGLQPAGVGGGHQQIQLQPHSAQKQTTTPPITSIKPSEITKRQLDSLRTSLRYFEDQLHYNKHQIDEKATKEQAEKIKQNIEHFENNYRMQLNFEAMHYPKSEQSTETIVPDTRPYKTPSRPSSILENRTGRSHRGSMESTGRPTLRYPKTMERGGRRPFPERNRLAVGINSTKTNNHQASRALEALEAHILKKLDESDPLKVADEALLRGAASAPPFQPGSNPQVSMAPGESNPSTAVMVPEESHHVPQPSAVGEYSQGQWQPGPLQQNQRGSWETMQSASTYFTNDSTPVEGQLPLEHLGRGGFATAPYLVGRLPPGMNSYNARGGDYLYPRELTEEEKRARHIYWGGVSSKGLGLPKFDGKDFYPPSPVKSSETKELPAPAGAQPTPIGCAETDRNLALRSAENDPFRLGRDINNIRSREGGQKFSKAIPIVAPDDVGRSDTPKANAKSSATASQASNLDKALKDCKLSPSDKSNAETANDKKATLQGRRDVERSSNKSGHDLWQTMLKKGSTSGNVLPSAVSSTTATGYLPQYFGHAAASLGPAISNPNGSPARTSPNGGNKPVEIDAVQGPAEKVGENCPPGEAPEADYDAATKDLHERMLRDAERRGVIGSDWQ
ncbi:hypothetical protein F5X99DRAFT_72898 [Biscogniauxia marginata]|nr:hypothetical protein F5X99DRAFT_72898 [Biscogniauxia marginata]